MSKILSRTFDSDKTDSMFMLKKAAKKEQFNHLDSNGRKWEARKSWNKTEFKTKKFVYF